MVSTEFYATFGLVATHLVKVRSHLEVSHRRRSHVTGTAERIARNGRRTGRIGSPVEYLARVKTEDSRAIIVDRRTWIGPTAWNLRPPRWPGQLLCELKLSAPSSRWFGWPQSCARGLLPPTTWLYPFPLVKPGNILSGDISLAGRKPWRILPSGWLIERWTWFCDTKEARTGFQSIAVLR